MAVETTSQLHLETRARWPIPNEMRLERPRASLDASVGLFQELFPLAVPRSVTSVYNCMGLPFAARRTWIDPEHAFRILQDDGYRRLRGPEEAEPGDIVLYRDEMGDMCHIGIVAQKVVTPADESGDWIKVLSKWGGDGEYLHDLSYLPTLLGMPAEFWTDRKGLP